MDVLNMSIGSAFMTWPQYPTGAAASALAERGMVVVASIGNSGASGVYSAGSPGVGTKVIGVASFDNSHINALTFNVNPGGQQVAYNKLSTTVDPPTSGESDAVVYVGRGCPIDPGYTTVADDYLADPNGKVALIDRGTCSFNGKYWRAVEAGATAVVIANNVPGLFAGGGVVDLGVPGVGISLADGNHIKELLESQTVTLTWTDERINAVNPTGGLISSFSSYGLTAELDLKPDIGAPGGLIRAPYPLEKAGYAVISGTSMSSPHVAGAAALLLEARPGLTWEQVRTTLQNTAQPVPYAAGQPFGEAVHRQGAGMLRIDRAIGSTASVTPSKLPLSYGNPAAVDVHTRTLTITNSGSEAVTYTPSFAVAVGTRGHSNAPILTGNWPDVEFSAESVTVPAGGSATVDATFDMTWASNPLFNHSQYGGHVVLTPEGGGQALRVPVAGFKGDYLGIEVLTAGACSFPGLFKEGGESECTTGGPLGGFTRQPDEGAVFTMADGDVPYFLFNLAHQSRRLEMTLLDAATGQPVQAKGRGVAWQPLLFATDYLARTSPDLRWTGYVWRGTIAQQSGRGAWVSRAVPDGQYKMQFRILKALGDAGNAAHWEDWTSPTITVARP
jgi:minor extracellular serine protease Vpr